MNHFLLFFLTSAVLSAQTEIFGLRTYANDDEYRPPIIVSGERITIEFDINTSLVPDLKIIFKHASRDWVADDNSFINPPDLRPAEQLSFTAAPNGVSNYTYRFKNSFPDDKNFVRFAFSGNYLFYIVESKNERSVLASGRFILAEQTVATAMTIENRYHPDFDPPYNQMLNVSVDVEIPDAYTAADENSIYHSDVRRVDIIPNWRILAPYRIDVSDTDPHTFVENVTSAKKTFWIRTVSPSNEYRRLDLSSTLAYPNGRTAIVRDQPDVSRFQWQSKPDANGAAKLKPFTGQWSDYLEVEQSLRLSSLPKHSVFLVGSFSDWIPDARYELKADPSDGLLKIRHWLRRGVYDYQFVLGRVEESGAVVDQDWLALEGNDWRTINRYTALVYYTDRRFGGVDRVIGMVRGRNPGTNDHLQRSVSSAPSRKLPLLINIQKAK